MKFKRFLNEHENVKQENKLLKAVIVILAITVMYSLYYVDRSSQREKIIIIPPQLHSRIVFNGDMPDKAYFDEMARYVISLALDYTSATARGQFAELLTLFAPSAFKEYQPVFYNLADRVQAAGNISNAFYITSIKVYPKKKKIIVSGVNYTYSADTLLTQKVSQYQIGYKIQAGRFLITSFGEVKREAE